MTASYIATASLLHMPSFLSVRYEVFFGSIDITDIRDLTQFDR